jgi:hypothetical protein
VAKRPLTIVTGASENHARPLLHLLKSLDRYEPGTRVIVYDLGLQPGTARTLRRQGRRLVPFRFEDYPEHVDRMRLRTYAWKPAMVHEVLLEFGLPLLYLDAGDLVHERLDRVRAEMTRIGFYSPHSDGTIETWCHPLTASALAIGSDILAMRNRNGAAIGFADCPLARELAATWYKLSMRPEVICPPGSSRANHRFDQTVLSVLLARAIRDHRFEPDNTRLGISVHNDRLSDGAARYYMRCDPSISREVVLRSYVESPPPLAQRLWDAAKRAWRRLVTGTSRG